MTKCFSQGRIESAIKQAFESIRFMAPMMSGDITRNTLLISKPVEVVFEALLTLYARNKCTAWFSISWNSLGLAAVRGLETCLS